METKNVADYIKVDTINLNYFVSIVSILWTIKREKEEMLKYGIL